jgi:hypothetical protein
MTSAGISEPTGQFREYSASDIIRITAIRITTTSTPVIVFILTTIIKILFKISDLC